MFLWLIVGIVCIVRLRHADMAFERDEGEYAYAGWSILQGGIPYLDFFNMKLPGVYYSYALIFKLFGFHVWVIRAVVLLLSMGSAYFIFHFSRRVLPAASPEVVAGCYLLMSVGYFSQGFISNSEHFVVFFVLAGLWSLARWPDMACSTVLSESCAT